MGCEFDPKFFDLHELQNRVDDFQRVIGEARWGVLPQIRKVPDMNTEFFHVTAAEYISGYLLKLTFSNGDVRVFDFSSIYDKGIFTKL